MPNDPEAYARYAAVYDRAGQSRFGLRMLAYLNELCALHGFDAGQYRALDVACGTGTVALALARAGWRVTAIDLSEEMLALARAKGRAAGVRVRWLRADMRDFRLAEPVDLAVCFYDSINHLLAARDLAAALAAVAAALRPGGFFLFDLNTEAKLAAWGDSVDRWSAGGIDQIWTTRFNRGHKIVTVSVTAYVPRPDGLYERVDESFRERAYAPATVRRALRAAGLELLGEYRCLTFDPPDADTFRVAYLVKKGVTSPAAAARRAAERRTP